jgi:hypothetical protein
VQALLVVGSRRGGEDAHGTGVPNRLGRAGDKENRPSARSRSVNAAFAVLLQVRCGETYSFVPDVNGLLANPFVLEVADVYISNFWPDNPEVSPRLNRTTPRPFKAFFL